MMIYSRKSCGFKKIIEHLLKVYAKNKLIYNKLSKLIQICLRDEYNKIVKFLKN